MFASTLMTSALWIFCTSTALVNIGVLFYRIFLVEKQTGANIFSCSLSISDLLMSVYLLGIGIADFSMKGSYIFQMDTWKDSFLCLGLGYLSSLSLILSSSTVMFILVFYMVALKYPAKVASVSHNMFVFACLMIWTVSAAILSPLLIFGETFSGSCLFFTMRTKNVALLSYQILIYLFFVDVIVVLSMTTCYKLIHFLSTSQRNIRSQGSVFGGASDYKTYKNFILLSLSVFIFASCPGFSRTFRNESGL